MKNIFRYIPIIGSFVEVSLNVIFSTLPVWFGLILLFVFDREKQDGIFNIIKNSLGSGELYLYATALLGSILYFLTKDFRTKSNFKSRRSYFLFCFILSIIAIGIFSVQRANLLFSEEIKLDQDVIFYSSIGIYLTTVLCVYLAHAYRSLYERSALGEMISQQHEFVEDFKEGQK